VGSGDSVVDGGLGHAAATASTSGTTAVGATPPRHRAARKAATALATLPLPWPPPLTTALQLPPLWYRLVGRSSLGLRRPGRGESGRVGVNDVGGGGGGFSAAGSTRVRGDLASHRMRLVVKRSGGAPARGKSATRELAAYEGVASKKSRT